MLLFSFIFIVLKGRNKFYSLRASAGKERVMRDAGNSDPAMAIALMSR